MPIHPILHIIYLFLKALVLGVFNIFFAKTIVINRNLLQFRNPAIVVSNHPNTLQDPLNVAARVKKVVFFLANASLFNTPLTNKLLSTFYCIPVERAKDVSGRPVRNEKNFEKCNNFLTSGGCLYIAPEGISDPARRLNSLRTGTARIALSAESKNDFQLGLTIVPVGLTYSAPTQFRSTVVLHVGEPIKVSFYKKEYEEDIFQAAKILTARIETELKTLILHTADDKEDKFLANLQTLLQSEAPLKARSEYLRAKQLLHSLQELRISNCEVCNKHSDQASHYFIQLAKWRIADKALLHFIRQRFDVLMLRYLPLLLLLLPVYIYGLVNHFPANFIPGLLARRLNLYLGYTATIKILSGMLIYPIVYGLQVYLVHHYLQHALVTLLYFISLVLSGPFVFWYQEQAGHFIHILRLRKVAKNEKHRYDSILQMRVGLVEFANMLLSNLAKNNTSAQ